jgi:hypothetical protein
MEEHTTKGASMPQPSKRELEDENRDLRDALEEIYDHVADLLGLEDDDEDIENDK